MESASRFERVVAGPGTRGQSSVMAGHLKGGKNHGGRGPAMRDDHT